MDCSALFECLQAQAELALDALGSAALPPGEALIVLVASGEFQRRQALRPSQRPRMAMSSAMPDDLASVVMGVQINPDVAHMQRHPAVRQHFACLRPRNAFTHDGETLPVPI